MADSSIDPNSGFNLQTHTFHSLRPQIPLPLFSQPLSITHYVTSLFNSTATSPETTTFLINATSDRRLSFSQFLSQTHSLSLSLKTLFPLSAGQTAFILCPPSLHVPVIYFSLLSLGIVLSPANPLSSVSELTHQVQLSKPVIAFATSKTSGKLPHLQLGTVLIDSPEFLSMLTQYTESNTKSDRVTDLVTVNQSDVAAILYSSGTTGKVKGVMLTHRNLIALISGLFHTESDDPKETTHQVSLFTLPLFHVFGFFIILRSAAKGETVVLMEKFEFEGMLKAVEKYKITSMPVSPPLVVAMAKSELVDKYDLSSLQTLGCGGAPLGKDVSERFSERFPNVVIAQGYGMTETGGAVTRMVGPYECQRHGSAGRLSENLEAKIVDPATGVHLGPGQRGELWLRGPTIMKGYISNADATAETFDSDGWLKTGDLCYFDSEGFLFIVDRLKELIKYKAYQVPPAELEHLLQSNPEIADAAVIPFPDEDAGQIPMAFVVRKPGSNITASQVMDFIAKQVAPYKKIRRVAFISSIPKSPAGKILRRELVSQAIAAHPSKL